ncbi:MAG: flagellar basal body rod protein FlgB [Pseudomonadota bacterium]
MDITDLPIMTALKQRMRWLTARQSVIAENLANADTPGYRPKRLKEQSFKDLLARQKAGLKTAAIASPMRKTSTEHLGIGGMDGRRLPQEFKAREYADERPNGNGVTLEEELVSLAETQIEYQTMLGVYRKHNSILRTALGRGGPR